MNEIRNKIQKDIVEPAANSRRLTLQVGTVIKANKNANTCNISYVRNDGKKINQNNVPVICNNISTVAWFPKDNEKVLIQTMEESIYIYGPSYERYEQIKNKIKLKQDILSDSNTDVLGGFIF